ncbi:MAG: hypothetical protein GQ557_01150 [Mycoplasmataceae bacterium]|nr:hypothetical protein [Mycoplasmataceae bacterium]
MSIFKSLFNKFKKEETLDEYINNIMEKLNTRFTPIECKFLNSNFHKNNTIMFVINNNLDRLVYYYSEYYDKVYIIFDLHSNYSTNISLVYNENIFDNIDIKYNNFSYDETSNNELNTILYNGIKALLIKTAENNLIENKKEIKNHIYNYAQNNFKVDNYGFYNKKIIDRYLRLGYNNINYNRSKIDIVIKTGYSILEDKIGNSILFDIKYNYEIIRMSKNKWLGIIILNTKQ